MGGSAEERTGAESERLAALLQLARIGRGGHQDQVLLAVVDVASRVLGYATVVVNLYRPGWDDFEVVWVHGPDEAREVLLHTVNTRQQWEEGILSASTQIVPNAFLFDGGTTAWPGVTTVYTPERVVVPAQPPDTAVWRAEDGLFLTLRASDGRWLGILSVDEPVSGRHPDADELAMLTAVADHAALAMETARDARTAQATHRALTTLVAIPERLAVETTASGVLQAACAGAIPDLGFQTATAVLRVGDVMVPVAPAGGEKRPIIPLPAASVLEAVLADSRHGCLLVRGADLTPQVATPSRRNGRGPDSWNDHRLIVPLWDADGDLVGAVVFNDPDDRMIPDDGRLQTARLLGDQTAAALEGISRQARLAYLANHDPLTGVLNRHALGRAASELPSGGLSVLVCDLDHFKAVNDGYGHDAGDQVLEVFGRLLRELSRPGDIAVRLGGEEFCLLLPDTDSAGAFAVAERLRLAVQGATDHIAAGVTTSIGIASAAPGQDPAVTDLVSRADRALYAAKAAGRNRSMLEEPAALPR